MGHREPSESEPRSAAGVPAGAGAAAAWCGGSGTPPASSFSSAHLPFCTHSLATCGGVPARPADPGRTRNRRETSPWKPAAQAMLQALCGDSPADPARRPRCAITVTTVLSRVRRLRPREVVTCHAAVSGGPGICSWGPPGSLGGQVRATAESGRGVGAQYKRRGRSREGKTLEHGGGGVWVPGALARPRVHLGRALGRGHEHGSVEDAPRGVEGGAGAWGEAAICRADLGWPSRGWRRPGRLADGLEVGTGVGGQRKKPDEGSGWWSHWALLEGPELWDGAGWWQGNEKKQHPEAGQSTRS